MTPPPISFQRKNTIKMIRFMISDTSNLGIPIDFFVLFFDKYDIVHKCDWGGGGIFRILSFFLF